MGEIIEGKFSIGKKETEVDKSKHYVCYFCEEEVEFSSDNWRHSSDGEVPCCTDATPSNIEIVPLKGG